MDCHTEANVNWLRKFSCISYLHRELIQINFRLPPLIEPIALDYKVCVCPFIDVIDAHDYSYQGIREGTRGTFDWKFSEFTILNSVTFSN